VEQEIVYEDIGEGRAYPRLLVSLSSVTALKDLCEHEHARYDKVDKTLRECRAAYYKELRWLRDQLHLAYQTDEESLARKASLTWKDFEVYWFQPPDYVDADTKDYLLACIRETNRKLIEENTQLQEEMTTYRVMESGSIKTVIRQLRRQHGPGTILRELHSQLRNRAEVQDLSQTADELLGERAPKEEAPAPPAPETEDPRVASLEKETEELRQRTKEDEVLIHELR